MLMPTSGSYSLLDGALFVYGCLGSAANAKGTA